MIKTVKYLESVLSDVEIIDECQLRANLSINGNNQFNILTHGVQETIDGKFYIMPDEKVGDDYLKIIIRPLDSTEQYTVFDGMIHGYENMFYDAHREIKRSLSLFEFKDSSVFTGVVTLGYSIEYDNEDGHYQIDKDGMIKVKNRNEKISWQQVQEEGYDWINIVFTNENGKTIEVDFQLA